jgi:hypothetical protein
MAPVVAASGEVVHAAWLEQKLWAEESPGGGMIGRQETFLAYARSTDGGATFSRPVRLYRSRGLMVGGPALVVHGNDVHLAWRANEPFEGQQPALGKVLYRRSDNGGTTWQARRRLSARGGTPRLAEALGMVHIVYEDDAGLVHRRSGTGGATWTAPRRISGEAPTMFSFGTVLAASDRFIHVVYATPPTTEGSQARYLRSTDRGRTWEPPADLGPLRWPSGPAALAAARRAVSLVYPHIATTPGEPPVIHLRSSSDGGGTWDPSEPFAPLLEQGAFTFSIDRSRWRVDLATVWRDSADRSHLDHWIGRSAGWSQWTVRVSARSFIGTVSPVDIDLDGSTAHVVWVENGIESGIKRVFYRIHR